ncbi:MAG TPA: S8 family serine peptidase [Longimicrobium sp.]|jgi:hypothetical protein|uniref:S8 family serine peptidase n=1 Tax=Longimicrobium sp. TaxID=2029185 RepID=UPI002ED8C742
MFAITAAVALSCMGCRDTTALALPPDPSAGHEYQSALFTCTLTVRSGGVQCTEGASGTAGGPSRALLGTGQIKMSSTNLQYDSVAYLTSFDAAVQNLMSVPIGTPDGVTRTGIKIFFEKLPTITAYTTGYDTGTVYVNNPDGSQNFSAANQPYFRYDTILPTNATSAWKRWQFRIPRSVASVSFSVRAFTYMPAEKPISQLPPENWLISPDSVARLYALPRLAWNDTRLPGPYPLNIVSIIFKYDASHEDRRSAIDVVNGEVIGGNGMSYFVLIKDNGTAGPLWTAVDRLRTMPQVAYAGPEILTLTDQGQYAVSNDGTGWRRTDWQLVPDSAGGPNWGAEAVAAPFGWGCEKGADATTIAVVDEGIHGDRVASIIGAPANDGQGMAGLMWSGHVTNDAGLPGADARRAFQDSAAVLNIARGQYFLNPDGTQRPPNPSAPADVAFADEYYRGWATGLDQLEHEFGIRPLYVLSAGNLGLDAAMSGLPKLAGDPRFASRVLVVGASAQGDSAAQHVRPRWTAPAAPVMRGSNTGPLVSIFAPGYLVSVADTGGVSLRTGTSYAAPHVAAAAGLLKSFDPRLTSEQIVSLILDGSRRGGWTTDGKPFLNIYESLKAAARRTGAPLCGQRYWMKNGQFTVQRDSATGSTQSLFTLPYSGVNPDVLHGGKQINFRQPNGTRLTYRWANGSWAPGTPDAGGSLRRGSNGSLLSRNEMSHDADSAVWWLPTVRTDSVVYRFEFVDSAYNSSGYIARVAGPRSTTPDQCIRQFVSVDSADDERLRTGPDSTRQVYQDWLTYINANPCEQAIEGPSSVTPSLRTAYSPRGESVYAFVATETGGSTVGPWFPCGKSGFWVEPVSGKYFDARVVMQCRNWTESHSSVGTSVYRISIPSGTVTALTWSGTNSELRFPSLSENLRQMTVESRTWTRTGSGSWVRGANDYEWILSGTTSTSPPDCRIQYRTPADGAVVFSAPTDCQAEGGDAGFSALRAPASWSPRH